MFSKTSLHRCVNITAAASVEPLVTTFVTDLEGDGLYFDRFVANSKVLSRDPKTRELNLRDGCRFVYGGDLYDKGCHDMRLCRDLLTLKARYPDRVTFIIGNRDLQKHKYLSMLDPSWYTNAVVRSHWKPYFTPGGITFDSFLAKRAAQIQKQSSSASSSAAAGMMNFEPSAYNYLAYLTNKCYGAAGSLDRIRQEVYEEGVLPQWKADGTRKSYAELREEFLEAVKKKTASSASSSAQCDKEAIRAFLRAQIPEEEVVALYKRLVDPTAAKPITSATLSSPSSSPSSVHELKGLYAQYADEGQLAATHDGVLFVHGAVKSHIIDYVPSLRLEERVYAKDEALPGEEVPVTELEQWVEGLNAFYHTALAEWRADPYFDKASLEACVQKMAATPPPSAPSSGSTSADASAPRGFPKRGGGALFAYGHSRSSKGKSTIINSFFRDAKPHAGADSPSGFDDLSYVDMKTVTFLGLGGVSAVMTGHQPVSDVPLLLAQPGLRIVCADNNYCDGKGGRGEAVSEVLFNGEDGAIRIHGKMVEGTPYDFTSEEDEVRVVGRKLQDGWWVRAEMPDGTFAVRRTKDRFFMEETAFLSLDEVKARLITAPNGSLSDYHAVDGEVTVPFSREELKPPRNHEKASPTLKTKRCCGSKDEVVGE